MIGLRIFGDDTKSMRKTIKEALDMMFRKIDAEKNFPSSRKKKLLD